jgi:hypothetical protein
MRPIVRAVLVTPAISKGQIFLRSDARLFTIGSR